MEPEHEVIVSVTEEGMARLDRVVADLRAAGLVVREVLGPLGMVTGSVRAGTAATLPDVPGVLDVEYARSYQLPPENGPRERR
ncbi:hypothetical protein FB471_0417 [Amycolatopsis cihanbeyliensis]|uniref:Ketohydroxyglutarate aldolase n=1 Tax=Amycolatopsis cihanbeyliensis TaxID=1128664 RepID=A0A542DCG1_AMYCI|nr:hypothetical protein FB471_0417 [Amycolatopsis cihanbeyliensis]